MFKLTCRQRGCALDPAEVVPELCPQCGHPLLPEDQTDADAVPEDRCVSGE